MSLFGRKTFKSERNDAQLEEDTVNETLVVVINALRHTRSEPRIDTLSNVELLDLIINNLEDCLEDEDDET